MSILLIVTFLDPRANLDMITFSINVCVVNEGIPGGCRIITTRHSGHDNSSGVIRILCRGPGGREHSRH